MVQLADYENCTGCMLCREICPNSAISMQKDNMTGFLYPVINRSECMECGLCQKICSNSVEVNKASIQTIYAFIAKNEEIRSLSTSGGAFYLLADEILNEGGYVAGARYDDKLHVYHTLVNCKEDLPELLRSKYVQSNMQKVYPLIKDALINGKRVLFCGTPCQVAGVKKMGRMLRKSDNLLLVDLVCRGVPSDKVQDLYLKQLQRERGSRIVKIEYKDKTFGWHELGIKYTMENGECFIERTDESALFLCFPGFDLSTRESCFSCRYKTRERISDITIGDFWGIDNSDWDDDKGTSLVFVNTEKGREIFDKIKERARYKEVSFSDVIKQGNSMAFSELTDHLWMRKRFWDQIENGDFRKTVKNIINDYTELTEKKRRSERAEKKYSLLLRWMELKLRGVKICEFFVDNDISSIAVYGAGDVGILVGEDMFEGRDIIKYYLDQYPRESLNEDISIRVLSLDDPRVFAVDAIIVTPVLITDEIEDAIWKRIPGQKVYELEEIFFYLSKKHGLDLSLWETG